MNNFIQYELWKDCRNNCVFCFNKKQPDLDKIISLNHVISKLDEEEVSNFNEVGFIGGEFFDNQLEDLKVKELWDKLFNKVLNMMDEGKFVKLYFTTSLLFKDLKYINEFLDLIKARGHLNKTLLCTSYDVIGRFHTSELLELWKHNMKTIHEKYPELMLHTEIIMTGAFIDSVLKNKFDINSFKQEYSTDVDYLQPNAGYYYKTKEEFNSVLPNFFPKRSEFIKFMKKTIIDDKTIDPNRIFNRNLQSDTVYIYVNSKEIKVQNRRKALAPLPCDMIKKSGYIDSDIPMKTDVDNLRMEIIDA